jgi:hypothetical protein
VRDGTSRLRTVVGHSFHDHRDVSAPLTGLAAEHRIATEVDSAPQHDAGVAQEVAMPLIYLPLIMYASWMELFTQPFGAVSAVDAVEKTDVEQSFANTRR